jgi:outer membrane immunogenic protein
VKLQARVAHHSGGIQMKKFVAVISFLCLTSGSVSAADDALKTVAAPALPTWAGFYIGGHGGYGLMDDPFSLPIPASPPLISTSINGFKSHGWVAGGQFGYNWQYAAMVGGLELDVSATGVKGNSAPAIILFGAQAPGSFTNQAYGDDVKLLGTARGRLGLAPNSDWLLYGTGGLAWERLDQIHVFTSAGPLGGSTTTSLSPVSLFGWVLGAGIEAKLMGSNWIARLEYLHHDFGRSRGATSTVATVPGQSSNSPAGDQTIDILRAALSYKFGS